ncbi:MAG: hypothetical protein FJ191_12765 [Gammaproteobacteria bacterium]|nr:hypothetical protein [Gammaproteobacteria bacterium]
MAALCRPLLLALLLTVAGCSNRDPAADAIRSAEDLLAELHEDAQEYVPDGYRELKDQLDGARAMFREERYKEAIAALADLPARAGVLATAAAAARERRSAELSTAWSGLLATMPGMLGAIELRLTELSGMRRLPQGIDAKLLEEARAALDSARADWATAGQTHQGGDLRTAVAQAQDAQGLVHELMARLGIQPG